MIKEYRSGDLASGFTGIRVAVSVGGKVKQSWFAYSEYTHTKAMLLAKELESKWLKLQQKHSRNAIQSKRSNTGIKGLSFTWYKNTRNNKQYCYLALGYQIKKNGIFLSNKWVIEIDGGIKKELWEAIALFIKNSRILNDKSYEWLRNNKPNGNKYLASYK